MQSDFESIALGTANSHIGRRALISERGESRLCEITGADCVDHKMVVSLDRHRARISSTCFVRLWTPQAKVAHCRCGGLCNIERNHNPVSVNAAELGSYVGSFAFIETWVDQMRADRTQRRLSPRPHRILSVERDGPAVMVEVAADELIADLNYRLQVQR